MKIMVFDVPAESGGALTILKQYNEIALNDEKNEWIFVVSTPELKSSHNVSIVKYPWVKISWFHRWYFDKFVAYKIVEKYGVDEILSLQNIIISRVDIKQTVYLHQPLPFIEKKYKISENFKFWIYQNIISKMIFNSVRKADKVIVQTQWIMDAIIQKCKVKKEKISLEKPKINIDVKQIYKPSKGGDKLFFYPASCAVYKNHEVIVDACRYLKERGISGYKIKFTLKGDENKHIRVLKQIVINEGLPIEFIGSVDINTVYEYYSKSILIFSSYVETFGLPLLEARMHNCPIIASDCMFSHEVLNGYTNVQYFNPHSKKNLARCIEMSL